jgi:dolichyl-phosphate beta-glucosyltransferase
MGFATYKGRDIDLKVIEYEKNKGKGGAVRLGMMVARGEFALMVDADGATKFSDIEKLIK